MGVVHPGMGVPAVCFGPGWHGCGPRRGRASKYLAVFLEKRILLAAIGEVLLPPRGDRAVGITGVPSKVQERRFRRKSARERFAIGDRRAFHARSKRQCRDLEFAGRFALFGPIPQ